MVSPFSHLETGMLKSPSLSDCIIVEGKGDNECKAVGSINPLNQWKPL